MHRLSRWSAIVATLAVLAPAAADAQITVYNSLSSWNSAVSLPGLDTFDDLEIGEGFYDSPLLRAAGPHSYELSSPEGFFPTGTAPDTWISNFFWQDGLTFSNFSSDVRAIGGNFFNTLVNGAPTGGQIQITLTSESFTSTQTLTNATSTTFLGFTTVGAISSMTVAVVNPNGITGPFATVNDIRLGAAPTSVVPEPSTYALLATGFVGLMGVSWRRRTR